MTLQVEPSREERLGLKKPAPHDVLNPVLPTKGAVLGFVKHPGCSAVLGSLLGALVVFFTFSLMLAPSPSSGGRAPAPPSPGAPSNNNYLSHPYDARADLAHHWSYVSDAATWNVAVNGPLIGPAQWGSIQDSTGVLRFPACDAAAFPLLQSPVALVDSTAVPGAGGQAQQLLRSYNSSALLIGPRDDRPGFEVLPLNESQSVFFPPGTNSPFYLKELHFHVPSEHTLNGEVFAMEGHFVHVSTDTPHRIASITILFREDTAAQRPNPYLRQLWPDIFAPTVVPTSAPINLTAFLDDVQPELYSYQGGLTAPPCTTATWYVSVSRTPVNAEQLSAFQYRMQQQDSNRPRQPMAGRAVTRYTLVPGSAPAP